jgi:electron transfer flavoprotein beta subunit
MQLPCVIGATRGLNEPRYPKLPDIMKAKKKEINQINLSDLGLDAASAQTEILSLEAVPERGEARILDGSPREAVEELVRVLREEEKVF